MSTRLQMRIQNSVKYLRWSALRKRQAVYYFQKTLDYRCFTCSEYASGLLKLYLSHDSKRDARERWYMPKWLSIPLMWKFFTYSEIINETSKPFRLKKLTKVKRKRINYSIWCFCSFICFFGRKTIFYIISNLDWELIIQITYAFHF